LFADQVMPTFQGSADRTLAAERYARGRWEELNTRQSDALQAATDRYAEQQQKPADAS
jgi:limonene 1,2-monooxygenase